MLRYIDMYNRTIPVTYNWKSILDQNQTSDLKFERTGTCLFALLLLYFFCILSCLLLYNYRRDCSLELLYGYLDIPTAIVTSSFTPIGIVLGESYVHTYDVVPTQAQRLQIIA